MDSFFLFTKHLDDQGCYCLKQSQQGELILPPAVRTFAEIKIVQEYCTTWIVESTINASLHDLEFPWLPERKAREALPFALEEQLAESIDELHFAFDKAHYQNKHYLIAVLNKQRMHYLMTIFKEKDIEFELITLDWFAVPAHTLCVFGNTLVVNNHDFKGALSGDLAAHYLKKHPLTQTLIFSDSTLTSDNPTEKQEEDSCTWIAQQLATLKPLNLCQGTMLKENASEWITKGYQLVAALAGFWLLSLLLVHGIALFIINKKTSLIDEQIAVIYHQFFPEAKQVISPKFRINQLLNTDSANAQTRFWFLLNQLAKVIKDNTTTIEQVRYQNKALLVTLICPDFSKLEQIEKKLAASQLKVKQTQASTQNQQVVATLELT